MQDMKLTDQVAGHEIAGEDGFGKALFLTHTAKNRYRVRTRGSPNSETDNVTAGRYGAFSANNLHSILGKYHL